MEIAGGPPKHKSYQEKIMIPSPNKKVAIASHTFLHKFWTPHETVHQLLYNKQSVKSVSLSINHSSS